MCVAYCLLCKQSIPQPDKPAAPFTQRGHRSLSIPTFLYYQILRCKIPFIPHSTFLISHWAKPIHSPFHIPNSTLGEAHSFPIPHSSSTQTNNLSTTFGGPPLLTQERRLLSVSIIYSIQSDFAPQNPRHYSLLITHCCEATLHC
jgi:hypothetical protein